MDGSYDSFEDRIHNSRNDVRRVVNQVSIRRNLRDTLNPFEMSVTEFRKLYRMPQDIFMNLVATIEPYCRVQANQSCVPLHIRVLCAIGFFACGSYQRQYGRGVDLAISQASVRNFITEVTEALNHPHIMARFIHFPKTHQERETVIERNARLGLPRVLGFVDGSYVKIFPPPMSEHKEGYYRRKGYTALNVQVVCDADLTIMAVDARFPGSCNDPYIFRNSGLREEMITAYRESRCWLLGDSGYGHEPWLHVPFAERCERVSRGEVHKGSLQSKECCGKILWGVESKVEMPAVRPLTSLRTH